MTDIALLPDHLWEEIFSLLPIFTLVTMTTVCRSWRSIIRSDAFISLYPAAAGDRRRNDLYFLLLAHDAGDDSYAAAYLPSSDRWLSLPLHRLREFPGSGGALLLTEEHHTGALHVCDVFARTRFPVPPMIGLRSKPYAIGLIDKSPSEFDIVAVAITPDGSFFQIYNSLVGNWVLHGQIPHQFAVIGNSAYVSGSGTLFCLSLGPPDCLLAYDPIKGECSLVDVAMPVPSISCPHILSHRESLFLVGGVEEIGGDIQSIVIWELDRDGKRWREFCSMPVEVFDEFRGGRKSLNHFFLVDRMGVLCFCRAPSYRPLMGDLAAVPARWWWAPPCPFEIPFLRRVWCGHALVPRIEVVR